MLSLPRSVQQLIIRKLDLNSFFDLRQSCHYFRNVRPGIVNILYTNIEKIKEMMIQNQIDEIYCNAEWMDLNHYFSGILLIAANHVNKIIVDCCNDKFPNDLKYFEDFKDYCVTHLSIYNNNSSCPLSQFLNRFKNLQHLYLSDNAQLFIIRDLSLQELDISGNCGITYIPLNSPISRSLRVLRITRNHRIKKIDHLYLTTLYCSHSQQYLITKYIPNVVLED